jgi:hypothetical protein
MLMAFAFPPLVLAFLLLPGCLVHVYAEPTLSQATIPDADLVGGSRQTFTAAGSFNLVRGSALTGNNYDLATLGIQSVLLVGSASSNVVAPPATIATGALGVGPGTAGPTIFNSSSPASYAVSGGQSGIGFQLTQATGSVTFRIITSSGNFGIMNLYLFFQGKQVSEQSWSMDSEKQYQVFDNQGRCFDEIRVVTDFSSLAFFVDDFGVRKSVGAGVDCSAPGVMVGSVAIGGILQSALAFDVDVAPTSLDPGGVRIYAMSTLSGCTNGNTTIEIWTRPGTVQGNTGSPSGWTLEIFGTATDIAAPVKFNRPICHSQVSFGAGFVIPRGKTGMFVRISGPNFQEYNRPNTANVYANQLVFDNGEVTLDFTNGMALSNFGGGINSPRVWNGKFYYDRNIASATTGLPAVVTTSTSGSVSSVMTTTSGSTTATGSSVSTTQSVASTTRILNTGAISTTSADKADSTAADNGAALLPLWIVLALVAVLLLCAVAVLVVLRRPRQKHSSKVPMDSVSSGGHSEGSGGDDYVYGNFDSSILHSASQTYAGFDTGKLESGEKVYQNFDSGVVSSGAEHSKHVIPSALHAEMGDGPVIPTLDVSKLQRGKKLGNGEFGEVKPSFPNSILLSLTYCTYARYLPVSTVTAQSQSSTCFRISRRKISPSSSPKRRSWPGFRRVKTSSSSLA